MVDVMVDFIISEGPAAVKIGKEIKSREVVKAVYLKLKYDHIDLVLEKFNEQCHQITHKKAYLRTMLYNSYLEIDAHYINLVNSDLMAHRNAI
jgi:hypothetical protein